MAVVDRRFVVEAGPAREPRPLPLPASQSTLRLRCATATDLENFVDRVHQSPEYGDIPREALTRHRQHGCLGCAEPLASPLRGRGIGGWCHAHRRNNPGAHRDARRRRRAGGGRHDWRWERYAGDRSPGRRLYRQRRWHGHVLADPARRLQGQSERRLRLLRGVHVHIRPRHRGSRFGHDSFGCAENTGNVTVNKLTSVDLASTDIALTTFACDANDCIETTEAPSRSPRHGPGSGKPSSRAARPI